MAQTKRKRRTKHRGTAAGTVEARGRTGRRPTAEERKKEARVQAREQRLNKPPSWRSSMNRAAIATIAVFFMLLLFNSMGKHHAKNPVIVAGVPALMAFLIYIPAGFYFDSMIYRRRQRRRQQPRK
jgi:anti-sigma-K factor RskA